VRWYARLPWLLNMAMTGASTVSSNEPALVWCANSTPSTATRITLQITTTPAHGRAEPASSGRPSLRRMRFTPILRYAIDVIRSVVGRVRRDGSRAAQESGASATARLAAPSLWHKFVIHLFLWRLLNLTW